MITTHYSVGNFILLVYRSNLTWNGGTATYTGWWALSDRQASNNKLKAGSVDIFGNTLVMRPDNSVHTSNEVLFGTDYNDLEETGLYNIRGLTTAITGG